ncbi:hypothetical protein Tco_0750542 [Tanacetum coccineum]|uniref:Uncharacterized protein n=1 Tax=Tanacetum coccineum TaxID=301880 RepID=A0ABQ4Z469_9ASTR
MERGFRGALRPLLPDMLLVATTNPSACQDHPDVAQSQPSSSTIPVPSTSTQPMTVDDLLQLVPQLMTRTDSLEKDLKQTKLTMGSAIVKLVKKVKKMEGILKRRNVVLLDSEEEEPEAQGRKSQDDPLVSLVQGLVTPSKTTVNASGEEQVEDISPTTLEAAKTLSRVASQKLKSIDKGRSIKVSTASGQEEASLTEAIRLDTLEKEEEAKQHYIDEDWDLIRAKIKANAELSKSMLGSGLQREDFAKKMVDLVNQRKKHFAEERARAKRNKPLTQSQLKTYMMNYLKNRGTWKLSQLKNLSFDEVKEEFDKLVKQVESFTPINFEATKDSLKRFGEDLKLQKIV